ncbi:hypothetical protein Tco_0498944 [Tanacetum coccineum]
MSITRVYTRIHNKKLVQTLLKGHSILSLEGSLSGDCDVEKNGKWSCIYAVGSQEYQMVCTRLDIASADVGMLDKFDRGLQTDVQVFVDFDYAMGRSITRGCKGGYLAKGTRNRVRIRAKDSRRVIESYKWYQSSGSRVLWLTRIDQEEVFVVHFFWKEHDRSILFGLPGSRQQKFLVLRFFDVKEQQGIDRVHGVHDEKRVWFEVKLQGAQGDHEVEVFQRSTQQCMKSGVTKHLGVTGIQQQSRLVNKINMTLFAKVVVYRNMGFNESGEYKKTFIGSGVDMGSMKVLQGVEFEVELQEDHTFEVEPHGNVDHVAGLEEVQTQDLIYYHLARDREQHSTHELFSYREDNNEAAFVVAEVEKIYAHESLTFNDTVAYKVISKWKAELKEDMDIRSDVCVLSNDCRKSSDNHYSEYAPGEPVSSDPYAVVKTDELLENYEVLEEIAFIVCILIYDKVVIFIGTRTMNGVGEHDTGFSARDGPAEEVDSTSGRLKLSDIIAKVIGHLGLEKTMLEASNSKTSERSTNDTPGKRHNIAKRRRGKRAALQAVFILKAKATARDVIVQVSYLLSDQRDLQSTGQSPEQEIASTN